MIKRIWRGWTEPQNAEAYKNLLKTFVFPGIEAKSIPGYRGIEMLHRDLADEVEFMTIMTFDSIDDVIAFQGDDYERCYVPDEARAILKRWDDTSSHYVIEETRCYEPA